MESLKGFTIEDEERKVYRKLRFKRGLSILTVYLLALALVVILLQMILPQVVQSIMDLATNMQYYLNGLERLVQQVTEQFHADQNGSCRHIFLHRLYRHIHHT